MSGKVISVGELTGSIKRTLENDFSNVSVRGELSNFKLHSSGHRYFTLKDSQAQISCTMWKSRNLTFMPTDGMKVVITGTVTVYPPRGNYQIECDSMIPEGQGDLFIAFEALKKKLNEEGYFDSERKRPIPSLPLKIGISTSPTGAAVKDIFSVIARRFPGLTVYFRPTLVQGEGSAEDIAQAIRELNRTDAELIIVGRGGGSIEDLWSYNTEIVAKEIFNSKVPVISAVGHETDFTIADFVADLRAATPTAAAELATPILLEDLKYVLDSNTSYLNRKIKEIIRDKYNLIGPNLEKYGKKSLIDKIKVYYQTLDGNDSSLNKSLNFAIETSRIKLNGLTSRIKAGHPLNPLDKGFAAIFAHGKFLSAEESMAKHKEVEIIRSNETAIAQIKKILPPKLL